MTINDITLFFESTDLSQFLLPFKIVALTLSAIFIYFIAYYNIKDGTLINDTKRRMMDFLSFQKFAPPKSFSNRAKEISALLDNKNYKRAILQTEVLFYELLKRFGYKGKNLLEMVEDEDTPNRESLKRLAEIAEEVRKKTRYVPDIDELDRLYSTFEDSLIKLGVITEEVED
ncbi:MAG TPA: hypothetical protein PLD14_02985 [Candidatus Pacearchaeota archaeon]|nr:hypothetical protein [Candidatus Pacearchaeota archaeon]HPR80162.1 hypothetical protein [Candidatus Pacearchaeota archaeon]